MLSKNQIKEIQSLQSKKFRDKHQLFIIEGIKSVSETLEFRSKDIEHIYGTELFLNSHAKILKKTAQNFSLITEDELKKISSQNNPNNVLALCRYFEEEQDVFNLNSHFSFYLDDIRDPGNLGTIIRLADWFGVSTLYCSENSCDLYNPKVIQASMGAFLRVQLVYAPLSEIIQQKSVKAVYGALLKGKNIYKESLENGLIIIGNEANGINDENLKYVNKPMKIPAHNTNSTESLNAAMAASILAAEFFRTLKN
jgi:RNA methyltransferase, TrmH family